MLSTVLLNRTLRNAHRWNSLVTHFIIHEDVNLLVRSYKRTAYCLEGCKRDVYKRSPLAEARGFPIRVEPTCLRCPGASGPSGASKDDKSDTKKLLETNEELKNRTKELKERIEALEKKEKELEKQSKELKSPSKNRSKTFKNEKKSTQETSWFGRFFSKGKNEKSMKPKEKPPAVKKTEVKPQSKPPLETKSNETKMKETAMPKKSDADVSLKPEKKCSDIKKAKEVPPNKANDLTSQPMENSKYYNDVKVDKQKETVKEGSCNSYPWPMSLFSGGTSTCKESETSPPPKKCKPKREDMTKKRDDMTTKRDDMFTKNEIEKKKVQQSEKEKNKPAKYKFPWPFDFWGKKDNKSGNKSENVLGKNKKPSASKGGSVGKSDGKNQANAEASKKPALVRRKKLEEINKREEAKKKAEEASKKLAEASKKPEQAAKKPPCGDDPCKKDKNTATCSVDNKPSTEECKDQDPPKKKDKTETKDVKNESMGPCKKPEEDCTKKEKEACTRKDCKLNQMVGVSDIMKRILLNDVSRYLILVKRYSQDTRECPVVPRTPFDATCQISNDVEQEMTQVRKAARDNRRRICGTFDIALCHKFQMTRPPEDMGKGKVKIGQARYVRRLLRKSVDPDCVPIDLCPSC